MSFRENYIEGQVSYSNFIGRTFCAWDYGITSKSVATLHKKIINTDLKVLCVEEKKVVLSSAGKVRSET